MDKEALEAKSCQPPAGFCPQSIRFEERSAGGAHALGVERGLVRGNRQIWRQRDQESELVATDRNRDFLVDCCTSTVRIQSLNVDIDHSRRKAWNKGSAGD